MNPPNQPKPSVVHPAPPIKKELMEWNEVAIAHALGIQVHEVREYFRDGRRVSFLIERRLAHKELGGRLAPTEGAAYDIMDRQGRKWECRSLSRHGVYFCPSYMVGSGRSFDRQGFLSKLGSISGYLIADIENFPRVPWWMVPRERVQEWWDGDKLGMQTKITREKALHLLEGRL